MKEQGKRILLVCLGNICRSPIAEGVLRHRAEQLAPALALRIDSAGTADDHQGDPPDRRAQSAARRRGIDISGLRARQVEARDFSHFDLILAMDSANLRDLKAIQPRAATASLGMFLDYATGVASLDVPDPYYGGAADFDHVVDLATNAADGLLQTLLQRT